MPRSVVVLIDDDDSHEALYVDGVLRQVWQELRSAQGEPTVCACDIAAVVSPEEQITFAHVHVRVPDGAAWPKELSDAMAWVSE